MNRHGLFIKLMGHYIPVSLLKVLEYWFSICSTCVIWHNVHSCMFKLTSGVRQGGVLSVSFCCLHWRRYNQKYNMHVVYIL